MEFHTPGWETVLSTAHKVHTGVLLQLLQINNPLLLDIMGSERDLQIKYSTSIRNGKLNSS